MGSSGLGQIEDQYVILQGVLDLVAVVCNAVVEFLRR